MRVLVLFNLFVVGFCVDSGAQCSRFNFESNLLELLVRLEFNLNQTNQRLEAETAQRSTDSAMFKERLHAIEERFESYKQDLISNVQGLTDGLQQANEGTRQQLEAIMTGAREHNPSQTITLDALVRDVIKNITVPRVSFLVKQMKREQLNDRVVFSNSVQNEGDSYDMNTGIFTCRIAGLYHFAFNFMSSTDHESPYCYVYHNDESFLYANAKGKYDSGTIVFYLYLGVRDKIDVRCGKWQHIYKGGTESLMTGSLIRL